MHRTKNNKKLINRVRNVRGNSSLSFLINISKYIHHNIGFDEVKGKYELRDFRKIKWEWQLFLKILLPPIRGTESSA